MFYYVLLTLDVDDGGVGARRDLFYKLLENSGFIKYKKLTTAWVCEFKNFTNESDVRTSVIKTIISSKALSKISGVEFVYSISDTVPIYTTL